VDLFGTNLDLYFGRICGALLATMAAISSCICIWRVVIPSRICLDTLDTLVHSHFLFAYSRDRKPSKSLPVGLLPSAEEPGKNRTARDFTRGRHTQTLRWEKSFQSFMSNAACYAYNKIRFSPLTRVILPICSPENPPNGLFPFVSFPCPSQAFLITPANVSIEHKAFTAMP
jgi:hypothetical protein